MKRLLVLAILLLSKPVMAFDWCNHIDEYPGPQNALKQQCKERMWDEQERVQRLILQRLALLEQYYQQMQQKQKDLKAWEDRLNKRERALNNRTK